MKIDIIAQVKKIIIDSIDKNIKQGNFQFKDIPEIILLAPKNKLHGDLSTNIALQLS